MGQKSKKGKQRKDKYYHLAKETGYRARSAFKLIQLDRKLKLFESSRVAIDLCAAPGGWLQVMQNSMPLSSIIIGVDIVPIKPIPNVITLEEDITTDSCVSAISKNLASWKADVVLNDGAPNVGQSWVQDAFTQSKLTLAAFKIATRFLKKGGCFVTKVFRSKDYLALNWAFKQLFLKVKATKPQASRNESAEIYVICQNFKAPDKIDPKFFDIKHVFKDMADPDAVSEKPDKLMIGKPVSKAKALGYEENTLTVYKAVSILEFLRAENYIPMLNFCSQLKLDDSEVSEHSLTTDEIRQYCEDVQVIGRKEVKLLLKWRSKMRSLFSEKLEISAEAKVPQHKNQTPALTEEEKEQQLEQHLTKLEKKKRQKQREQRIKLRQKMALGKEAFVQEDDSLFTLTAMKSKSHLEKYEGNAERVFNEGADDDFDHKNEQRNKKLEKCRVDQSMRNEWMDELYSEDEADQEIEFESDSDQESENDEGEVGNPEKEEIFVPESEANPLLATEISETSAAQKANLWYASHDVFDGLVGGLDNDVDLERELAAEEEKEILKKSKTRAPQGTSKSGKRNDDVEVENALNVAKLAMGSSLGKQPLDDRFDDDSTDEEENFADDPKSSDSEPEVDVSRTAKKSAKRKLTAEQLALGHEIAFSAKRRREIIEAGFNRYVYDDVPDSLPSWFQQDEDRASKPMIPLNKELVQMYRDRLKEINARPIKKVAEARARKKMKTVKKLENIRGKAEKIASTEGASEREKLLQIKGLYKKYKVNKKLNKEKTYVVSKKKGGKATNPSKGSKKGPVKFVDKRMKADKRKKMKNSEKKNKKILASKSQKSKKSHIGINKKRPKSR